jgi:nucleoside-diphosphate-sugar epimerase
MTILVTGASGHLGANLVRRLLDNGQDVRVLLREGSNNAAVDGLDVERVYGDLRDFVGMKSAVRGCEQIYHCAAKVSTLDGNPLLKREIYDCNVLGTIHILQAALEAGVSKVVVSGSFSAVGHNPEKPSDETVPFYPFSPHLPYGFSKTFVEHECLKAFANGLSVVVAVSCAILGPNDHKPSRMGRTLLDFANGKLLAYVPGGFEFISARDIVEGHILAMSKGRPGQKYIFSSQFLTVDELMAIFEEVTGRDRPALRIPGAMIAGIAGVADFVFPPIFSKCTKTFHFRRCSHPTNVSPCRYQKS